MILISIRDEYCYKTQYTTCGQCTVGFDFILGLRSLNGHNQWLSMMTLDFGFNTHPKKDTMFWNISAILILFNGF